MPRSHRILTFAAVASVVLHLAALMAVPAFDLYPPEADEGAAPLEAWIVPRPPAPPASVAPTRKSEGAKSQNRRSAEEAPAPRNAPRWIARPEDFGAIPPLPDGDYAELAESKPVDSGQAAGGPSGEGVTARDKNAAAAAYPVRRARLVYDLYYGGGPAGVLTHTWFTDGHVYRAESVAEGVGLVKLFYSGKFVQRSTGRLGPEGLIPGEYTLQRGSAARSESARFDWGRGKLSLDWKDQHRVVDLPAGTQDALSIVHQAYFVPPTAAAAPLGVATSRKLGHYRIELVGEDLIETPIGILRTVHIRRAEEDGAKIDVWLDIDRGLLPARILGVDRRGSAFEQMIREAAVEG